MSIVDRINDTDENSAMTFSFAKDKRVSLEYDSGSSIQIKK